MKLIVERSTIREQDIWVTGEELGIFLFLFFVRNEIFCCELWVCFYKIEFPLKMHCICTIVSINYIKRVMMKSKV